MLVGLASWVIVGHSERRRDAGETDELIGRKLARAIDAGLRPILCVGERLEEREAGRAGGHRRSAGAGRAARPGPGAPARRAASSSPTSRSGRSGPGATRAVATRPPWPSAIRSVLTGLGWDRGADDVPVLYGGSVTSANIAEFLAEPSIDGALVGGASLKPDEMAGIVARAGLTAAARAARGEPRRAPSGCDTGRTTPDRDRSSSSSSTGSGSATTRRPTRSPPRGCRPGDRCSRDWPHATLGASEEAVGLPPGQMGNSEVGHLNLGAGRPVLQDLPRIDAAIADGSFDPTPALLDACQRATRPGGRLHIVSLVGPGGVHANDRHLVALVELAARLHVPSVRVHALLDGRDTPPTIRPRVRRRPRASPGRGASRTPGSRRSAAATTRWIATGAGTASSEATTRSSIRGGGACAERDRGHRGRLRPRRERRVRRADRDRRRSTAWSATATRSSTPTSGPTAPGS